MQFMQHKLSVHSTIVIIQQKYEIHRIFSRLQLRCSANLGVIVPTYILDKEATVVVLRSARGSVRGAKKGRRELCLVINGTSHDFRGVQYALRNLRGVARAVAEERETRRFETTTRHRDCRARGAPSSPHLNKTAVSCVYRVQRERESGADKRLQIVPVTNRRALLLAHFWRGWLTT